MQTMRDKWTDERLDDLNVKVDRGFERLDTDIRELRAEMHARFDSQNRTMLWFAGTLIVAIFASNLAIVGAMLTS